MSKTFTYLHQIQYYETDGMRIVHHSNYIRWMEEARTAMMEEMEYGYDRMECDGISCPVISLQCEYKQSMRFGQTCRIETSISSLSPVRTTISYSFYNAETGDLCFTAASGHCFVNPEGRPVSLKRKNPEVFELFSRTANSEDA